MRTLHRTAVLSVIVALAGCGESDPSRLPLAPTPIGQPAPPPAQGPVVAPLRGTVWDTAFRPLADATLQVIAGPHAGASTTSNAAGQFAFVLESVDEMTTVRAEKEGYVTATRAPFRCPGCPHYNVGFQLALPISPLSLAGEHTLTFVADPACTVMPSEFRTRTYLATLTASTHPSAVPNTQFTATVAGAEFLRHLSTFYVYVAGDYVAFNLDDSEGPPLVEEIAANTYVAIGGAASTTVAPGASVIVAPFIGTIDYCASGAPVSSSFNCAATLARARCVSANHQLVLTRR